MKKSGENIKKTALNFGKFLLSSFSASIIDIGLFSVILYLLKQSIDETVSITVATVAARAVSSLYNYFINRNLVFNDDKRRITIFKYYVLCVCQMMCSAGLVSLLYGITHIQETVVKVLVDVFLFFISYRIQKIFVFGKKKK